MAITLIPSDLIHPQGELMPVLFPDGTLEDNIETWLTEAMASTVIAALPGATINDAARHFICAKAYRAAAQWMAMQPATHNRDGMSKSWSQGRIEYLAGKADEHEAAYESLVATSESVSLGGFFVTAGACRYV